VGSPGVAGSASWNGSAFTIRGSGADIWNNADGFHFVYRTLTGNGEIRARVSSLTTTTDPWAKAGVMIRQSLTAGSPHAMMAVTPGNGTAFQWRVNVNDVSLHTAGPVVTAPHWVRLVRSGNTLTGYTSPNGTTWTLVGTVSIALPSTVYVGLPITSHNNGLLATAVIDQVTLSASASLQSQDVGSTGVAGSTTVSGSTYTLRGSGADIWNNADAFQFSYQPVSGDASVVARVDTLQNTDAWAKAGVMIRESLAPNARHVMMAISPGNGAAFQRRTTTGGSSTHTAGPAVKAPYWLRVVRSGNTFTASVSANGSTWSTVGSVSVSMAGNAYAGLVVTSHNNAVAATATFSQVTIVP
jgi:regulation of enolase protein 1 (concanavalin A-like superfamily)